MSSSSTASSLVSSVREDTPQMKFQLLAKIYELEQFTLNLVDPNSFQEIV